MTESHEPAAAEASSATPTATAAASTRAAIAAATSVDLRIPKTMRALVKTRPEPGAELREVPVPRPGPGEVLIRLEAVSLCGTDLHIYRWDPWAQGRLGKYLPRIFGHEMAGRVVGHGPGTGAVPLGTRPTSSTGPAISAGPAASTFAPTFGSWALTPTELSPNTCACPSATPGRARG